MTGVSPAELLFGRCIRSRLQQLLPDLSTRVEAKQAAQKCNHDGHTNLRVFQIGDPVFVRNFTNGPTWISGKIKEKRGPLSYTVTLSDGRIVKKHVDQIRSRTVNVPNADVHDFLPTPVIESPSSATTTPALAAPTLRGSTRVSNPPERYSPVNYT